MRNWGRNQEVEEPSEESLMTAELARLQRSYRVMQNDYKAYREETKRIMNKQSMLIGGLEAERAELDTTLMNIESRQNTDKDEQSMECLTKLAGDEAHYQQLLIEESHKIKALDSQILAAQRKIAHKRKVIGGEHNSTTKHIATQKKIGVLENRLDKAMVLFNKQLAVNKELREEIDHFRRDRSVFQNLHKKLTKELEVSKQEMAEVIQTTTQAFEQRDEAQNKMQALRERRERDQQQHDAVMKDLLRSLSHDDRIKQFMNIKANDRADYRIEEAAKRKKHVHDRGPDAAIALIEEYEEAFKCIREVTNEDDIDVIVRDFITTEEENFALFNYVTELNSDVEQLREEVVTIKSDIELFKEEGVEFDEQHKLFLKELEAKYEQAQKESDSAEECMRGINKVLDQLRSGVESLFKKINCDPRPIQQMLGGENGITNKNIIVYLGQIEHRATEMLGIQHYHKLKKSELQGGVLPKSEPAAGPPLESQIQIVPPSTGDDDTVDHEIDEEDLFPLSVRELRDQVMHGIDRKTTAAMKLAAQINDLAKRDQKKKTRN